MNYRNLIGDSLIGYRIWLLLVWLLMSGSSILAQEVRPVVLRGQVACSNCWAEADRDKVAYGTPDDLECAMDCDVKGYGGVLAVRDDKATTLYYLEFGKTPRTVKGWLENVAKIVEVSGGTYQKAGKRYLKVESLTVLADNPVLAAANTKVGQQAANLTLTDLTGATQSLQSYQGKIVVLNFWATWCAPCRAEMPEFISLQNANAAFGVQVIGASADAVDNRAAVIKFVREAQLNFPIWLGANTADLANLGLSNALPGTVVIDRQGKVVTVINGATTAKQLQPIIDKLLTETVNTAPALNPAAERSAVENTVPTVPDARPTLAPAATVATNATTITDATNVVNATTVANATNAANISAARPMASSSVPS